MNKLSKPYPKNTEATSGDQMEMSGSEVQAIQNRETGMAIHPPSIVYHSRYSGESFALGSPLRSLSDERSRLAQPYISGVKAVDTHKPTPIARKHKPVVPGEMPWMSVKIKSYPSRKVKRTT